MSLRKRLEISPAAFQIVTRVALASLTIIVVTGAAVRLSGSGLGCPDWPKCFGQVIAPAKTPAIIEYSNRLITGVVSLAVIAAAVLGWFRKPFRRELALIAILLPLGVAAQAILGAFVVKYKLNYGSVMAHYVLSMVLVDAAFALAWCATFEPGDRPRARDRLGVWCVRALFPVGVVTITAGTAATAAGPNAGASGTGEHIGRLHFFGSDTLTWMVRGHGTLAIIFGLSVIAVIMVLRRPGGEQRAIRPLLFVLGFLVAQGALGITQWLLKLPPGLVWFHVTLAVLMWLCVLWSVASAGLLEGELTSPTPAEV